MTNGQNRYKTMSRNMTLVLIADCILFIIYLAAAGVGVVWLKVVSAILTILVAGLCLAFLYLTKELLRQRSLWMTTAAAALVICVLFSLILNFPSPSPFAQDHTDPPVSAVTNQI